MSKTQTGREAASVYAEGYNVCEKHHEKDKKRYVLAGNRSRCRRSEDARRSYFT